MHMFAENMSNLSTKLGISHLFIVFIFIIVSSVREVPEVCEDGKRHDQCLGSCILHLLEFDLVVLNILKTPAAKAHLEQAFHPLLHHPHYISITVFQWEVDRLARADWKRAAKTPLANATLGMKQVIILMVTDIKCHVRGADCHRIPDATDLIAMLIEHLHDGATEAAAYEAAVFLVMEDFAGVADVADHVHINLEGSTIWTRILELPHATTSLLLRIENPAPAGVDIVLVLGLPEAEERLEFTHALLHEYLVLAGQRCHRARHVQLHWLT